MSQEFESRKQRRLAESQASLEPIPVAWSEQQARALPDQPPVVPTLPSVEDRLQQLYRPAETSVPEAAPSRRELRQQSTPSSSTPSAFQANVAQSIPLPEQPAKSRRDLRDQLRQAPVPPEVPVTPFAQPWSEPAITPMFETSSGFSLDTTTNSIVLPVTPDALTGALVTENGVTLKTGSIPLPNLNTSTGSIPLPEAAQRADEAQRLDSSSSFVSSISPVAAQNLISQNPKLGFAPIKSKGSQGQLFYGLTISIIMLTVGALSIVAWMYGLIK